MSLFNRRFFLLATAALGGCGFTPVYGPEGGGNRLLNRIMLDQPDSLYEYAFARRFEERLGRGGTAAPYRLTVAISTEKQGLGSTTSGYTTRFRTDGRAVYALRDMVTNETLIEGRTEAFTGFSTTGSTVATLASERDAGERLMTILADQVIDQLILAAEDLPADASQ